MGLCFFRKLQFLIGALLLLCCVSYAETDDSTKVDSKEARKEAYKASDGGIPLPRQLSYTGKGISIGLGLGYMLPIGDGNDDAVAAWRGAGEYFYQPWLSAGTDVLIYGGDIDKDVMLLYSRYRLHTRAHLNLGRFDFFLGPMVWFETTDIDIIREEIELDRASGDTLYYHSSVYDDAPDQNGFAVGSELGFGVRLPWHLGAFGEGVYEYSFAGKNIMSYSIGLGFDLRGVSDFFKRNVYAAWITFEATKRHYARDDWENVGKYVFLGINLAL